MITATSAVASVMRRRLGEVMQRHGEEGGGRMQGWGRAIGVEEVVRGMGACSGERNGVVGGECGRERGVVVGWREFYGKE